MNNHGKVFTISDANQLESDSIIPKRNKLLNSKQSDDTITTKKIITGNKPLLFLGNDVSQSISKNQYELILHGITPCGSKTTITIKGIFPYIDLETEVGIAINEQVSKLQTKLNNLDLDVKSIKVMAGKNFMKFHEEQRQYMRVYFNTLKHRLDFIKYCTENNINTFSNDRSTYYRVVARDYEFNLSGWNTIKSYTQVWDGLYKSQYSFTIDVSDISAFDPDQMKENNTGYDRQLFKYEKMIIGSFDIEMIPFNLNKFPDADKCIKDSIFMICVTFHFAKKPESLLSVNLTLRENDPLDDVVTIVCETEACLLLAFSKLFDMVQPEFITEFNGGGFDWRNIMTKAEYYGIIPQFLQNMSIAHMQHWETKVTMLSRYYQEKMIKINGATAPSFCKSLKMQGYVNFDTLIMFKQLEPNADSHKLNECLKRCNLGSKDDMDIKEMFRIYLHGTATEMKMVAHYCFIDTFKLQALLLKKNVIQDRRELSTLSMTSIFDAFYFANGSKVRNILMNVGEKVGYKFDTTYKPTIEDPDAKFPGAFVVPPIKGIVRPRLSLSEYIKENNQIVSEKQMRDGYKYIKNNYDAIVSKDLIKKDVPEAIEPYIDYMLTNDTQYPISGLDFASLYPSIMMAYNISPEKLITDESYANQMIAHGYKIHHVTFPFLDKDVHAWFIQHENNPENYGLCPAILIDLFAKRAALKKILKPFADKKLEMEMDMKEYENGSYPNMKEYDEVCFDYEYFNSKQKALKVFMNTFYGELGNFMSFVCAVETAASVTTLGRYNLRLAKSYVEDHLYMKVYYGDTDSLYVACNQMHFVDLDKDYFTGKIDKLTYCTGLVNKTFEMIEIAKKEVNIHLEKDNGTKFLKMAYEEVLFPVVFVSKKKYFGIPHEEVVNFYPKKPFIRGLEIIKRGASDVLKNVCLQIVKEILDINTTTNMLVLVDNATKRFFTTEWDVNHFIKTAVYRPDKQNASVRNMIARYETDQYHSIPEPNVRFKYVVCKKYQWTYNDKGNQTILSIGDKMELIDRVIEESIPIDLEYYFNNEITGQMARFIAFHDEFNTIDREAISSELTDKERYTKIEDSMFKNAKKYITNRAKEYSNPYKNKSVLFKQTYKIVADSIRVKDSKSKKIKTIYPSSVIKVTTILDGCNEDNTLTYMRKQIENYVNKYYQVDATISNLDMDEMFSYITDNDLFKYMKDCSEEWISNVVRFIRTEFDYDVICEQSLDIDNPLEIFTRDDLENIISNPDLYVGLSDLHARNILDMISKLVSAIC